MPESRQESKDGTNKEELNERQRKTRLIILDLMKLFKYKKSESNAPTKSNIPSITMNIFIYIYIYIYIIERERDVRRQNKQYSYMINDSIIKD